MALRVTASIVGLTTSRDEKSSPVMLDMVPRNVLFVATRPAADCSEAVRRGEREGNIGLLQEEH